MQKHYTNKIRFKVFLTVNMLCALNLLKAQTANDLYQDAVKDACYTESKKVINTLINLYDSKNTLDTVVCFERYILVATLKEKRFSYPLSGYYYTASRETWVTAVPELQNKFKTYNPAPQDKSMRVKQLLGLPPGFKDSCFIEMWVKPADIFRPCPDSETDDNTCQINFAGNESLQHANWIMNTKNSSCCNPDNNLRYPWTQLGYTYDWNHENKTHAGVSEFVVKKYSDVIIRKIYSTEEYLK